MSLELLDPTLRWVAIFGAAGCGLLALLLARKRLAPALVIALAFSASIAALILGVEQGVSFIISRSGDTSADYNEYRWVLLSPWGRTGLVVGSIITAAVIALSVFTSRQVLSLWRRTGMIILRSAGAMTALVLFLEPAIELRQVAREPNHIAVVVDDSESMSLRDQTSGPSRMDRVRELLSESATTLDRWRADHILDFYTLSSSLTPQSESNAAPAAKGNATQIRVGLEQLRQKYDGTDLAGVILLSDGLATGKFVDGATDGASRDFLRSLETRVHTVWAARDGLRDTAIVRVLADEFAFVRTVVRIEAVIRSTGYGKRRIPVTLSSEGVPLRRQWVELEAGSTEAKVAFEFTPSQVGRYVYRVDTPVDGGEAVSSNNERSFILRVIRDKFRVLQVAGRPSWDVRALRGMLKQNPNVDLISFFILRMNTDISMAANSEMSLIPFPTDELFKEQLPSFDLVILQNYNFLPYGMARYLGNLRDYVRDGGALVMLGGSLSFTSGGYYRTPIDELLPVALLPGSARASSLVDEGDFAPLLTDIGRSHPITSLRYDPDAGGAPDPKNAERQTHARNGSRRIWQRQNSCRDHRYTLALELSRCGEGVGRWSRI
jgi:hypothetical protein